MKGADPEALLPPAAPAWFRHVRGDETRCGVAQPDGRGGVDLFDVGPRDVLDALASAGGLRAAHLAAWLATDSTVPLDPAKVEFAVPVARPSKILCLGKNYAAHAAEFGAEVPPDPIFFTKLVDTLSPHGSPVVLPHWVDTRIDHEVELAVVLGFDGPPRRYVEPAEALDLVAGYSIFDDVTARRMQGDDRQNRWPWLRCKSFDTFGPFGPWVVPADALDATDLAISLRVNDEVRQSSRTSLQVVDVPHAIAWLSRHTSLRPGDLIAMGTPEGVGPLCEGDRVECSIEGIGRLVHGVTREATPD